MKVIFHLNDVTRFKDCYSNVKNLLKEPEEIEEIRILINADNVRLVIKNEDSQVKELLDAGVFISVCQNSLNSNNIDKTELEDGIEFVRTGVFELMKRQEQGYSYIKI